MAKRRFTKKQKECLIMMDPQATYEAELHVSSDLWKTWKSVCVQAYDDGTGDYRYYIPSNATVKSLIERGYIDHILECRARLTSKGIEARQALFPRQALLPGEDDHVRQS